MGPSADLDSVEMKIIPSPPRESNSRIPIILAHNQSLKKWMNVIYGVHISKEIQS